MNAVGLEDEGMKEIIEEARIEDRNHFEALLPRIYELGGRLPDDIRSFADQAGCPDASLPDSLGGVVAERRASSSSTADDIDTVVRAEIGAISRHAVYDGHLSHLQPDGRRGLCGGLHPVLDGRRRLALRDRRSRGHVLEPMSRVCRGDFCRVRRLKAIRSVRHQLSDTAWIRSNQGQEQ